MSSRSAGRMIWEIINFSAPPLLPGEVMGQIILQTTSKCVRSKQIVGRGQYGFMMKGASVHKVLQIKFWTWAGRAPGTTTGWAPAGRSLVWQKKMWHLCGHQVGLKPARCPCGKGSQWPPGLCEKCCHRLRWVILSSSSALVTHIWVHPVSSSELPSSKEKRTY